MTLVTHQHRIVDLQTLFGPARGALDGEEPDLELPAGPGRAGAEEAAWLERPRTGLEVHHPLEVVDEREIEIACRAGRPDIDRMVVHRRPRQRVGRTRVRQE